MISVYDVRMERILRRAGCGFELCEPQKIGDVMTVAGLCETATSITDEIAPATIRSRLALRRSGMDDFAPIAA